MTPMRTTTAAVAQFEPQAGSTEVRRTARLTRAQVVIVVASMIVTAALAGALAAVNPPIYETTRGVMVQGGQNANDNEILTRALQSIIESKNLAAAVKTRGDLPQSIDAIAAMISTSRAPESPYMDVIASSPDREESEAISAQIIPALTFLFEDAQRNTPVEQRIQNSVFQEVGSPLQNTSRFPLWFAILFGLLLGGLVPFLFFVVRNLRRPVVESAQDVTDAIDLPILARVPALGARGASAQDSVSGIVAAVERLSLNEPVHRLVLVGADDGEQRAELALGLSCMIARSFGQPVALIDADLDNGVLSSLLHTTDIAGLAECLAGQLDADTALVPVTDDRLPSSLDGFGAPDGMVRFLGVGVDTSRNILRMRSNFHRVLEDLAGRYVVIVNGPRLPGPVPSSQLLSLADATLMVVAEGRTSLTDARSAGDTLRSFSAGASGVIVLRG